LFVPCAARIILELYPSRSGQTYHGIFICGQIPRPSQFHRSKVVKSTLRIQILLYQTMGGTCHAALSHLNRQGAPVQVPCDVIPYCSLYLHGGALGNAGGSISLNKAQMHSTPVHEMAQDVDCSVSTEYSTRAQSECQMLRRESSCEELKCERKFIAPPFSS
jgi:hypothetical protein